jgi:hypothetical protein
LFTFLNGEQHVSSLITGVFSVVSVAVSGCFALLVARSRRVQRAEERADVAERELGFQTMSLGFDDFESDQQELEQDIKDLLEETNIDRVLKLKAWNGKYHPKYVTAYIQYRQDPSGFVKYVNYPIDEDYGHRLRATRDHGWRIYTVYDDPDSNIMQSYIAEGVKVSLWVAVEEVSLVDSESKCVFFMSFSSHTSKTISTTERESCILIAQRYAARVREYHHNRTDTYVEGD